MILPGNMIDEYFDIRCYHFLDLAGLKEELTFKQERET